MCRTLLLRRWRTHTHANHACWAQAHHQDTELAERAASREPGVGEKTWVNERGARASAHYRRGAATTSRARSGRTSPARLQTGELHRLAMTLQELSNIVWKEITLFPLTTTRHLPDALQGPFRDLQAQVYSVAAQSTGISHAQQDAAQFLAILLPQLLLWIPTEHTPKQDDINWIRQRRSKMRTHTNVT